MAGSESEREIRDYAANRLRQMIPDARVIHELVVGGCRADLAAVQRERITLIEIKSERDTLSRLSEQIRQFERAAHEVVVIAHERWFDTTPYNNGQPRFAASDELSSGANLSEIWAYPERDDRGLLYNRWSLARYWSARPEPHAAQLLGLLWRSELRMEAERHRIASGTRTTVATLIRDMAWHMTGAEIARAVCRQLRQRKFPEADEPIDPASLKEKKG